MKERIAETSPRLKARMAGALYVLAGLTSVVGGMYIPGKLVVVGNAATTANAILTHKLLFELGSSVMLIAVVCSILLTVLFYDLFKVVNKTLSLTAAFIHLVGLAILGVASVFQLAPLVVLEGGQYLSVFRPEQVQALAYLFLQLNTQAGNVLAGLGYLTFLSPPLAAYLSPYNLAPAALGEGSLMLWLLVVGVNAEQWKEQASMRGVPPRMNP
jgi:hypothetical protein